jgi:hypothetical protein
MNKSRVPMPMKINENEEEEEEKRKTNEQLLKKTIINKSE